MLLSAASVEKKVNCPEQNAVVNGYVMTETNTSRFPMQGTAVTETTAVLHFAVIIIMRSIPGIGRLAKSAGLILKQRCMSITALMNTILKNWKILLIMSLPCAANAVLLLC